MKRVNIGMYRYLTAIQSHHKLLTSREFSHCFSLLENIHFKYCYYRGGGGERIMKQLAPKKKIFNLYFTCSLYSTVAMQ